MRKSEYGFAADNDPANAGHEGKVHKSSAEGKLETNPSPHDATPSNGGHNPDVAKYQKKDAGRPTGQA